ncbi:hypothetical protein ALC57_18661 [Trachymyrmex cornetzi]|uniref:Uncharacterized protein n=1 Tax=Trachymyrmex cornetzi TaxID=471704 RepID=A0A195D8P2_9HYME|nr:hypothetical protein ALC57_18661 [Trachymyrmex cornetzi]
MILRYATPFPGESDGAAPLLHMARARYMGENSTPNRSSERVYKRAPRFYDRKGDLRYFREDEISKEIKSSWLWFNDTLYLLADDSLRVRWASSYVLPGALTMSQGRSIFGRKLLTLILYEYGSR